MATTRPTQGKRQRERVKQERMQEKEQLRAQRKEAKAVRDENRVDGEDPDLAGIVPGPQPQIED